MRKATDATGKGAEEDPYSGGSSYKPKMPGNRGAVGRGAGRGGRPTAEAEPSAKKIPKWKL